MSGHIGRYEIQAELGQGGFGKVYSAFDPTVRRHVAIKVLTSLSDAELVARFRSETFTTGNLHHTNIVTVYDYGEENGAPYLVMELLEGRNLKDLLADRRIVVPLDERVD